jgi:hypothetical protein
VCLSILVNGTSFRYLLAGLGLDKGTPAHEVVRAEPRAGSGCSRR